MTAPKMMLASSWAASATRRALGPALQSLGKERGVKLEVGRTLQSFPALVQLARAGFGLALVPLGIARAMGTSAASILSLPGLTRPITLFGRKTAFQRSEVVALVKAVREHFAAHAP